MLPKGAIVLLPLDACWTNKLVVNRRGDDCIAVTCYKFPEKTLARQNVSGKHTDATDILLFCRDGRVVLRLGGHKTISMRDRINQFLPKEWWLTKCEDEWCIQRWRQHRNRGESFLEGAWYFTDGMVLHPGGSVEGANPFRIKHE